MTNQNGKLGKVDRMPLVEFVKIEMERRNLSYEDIAKGVENLTAARVSWIMQGAEPSSKVKSGVVELRWISLHRVDQILRGLDREEELTILYTDEVINASQQAQEKEASAQTQRAKRKKKAKRKATREKERGHAGRA